MKKRFVPIYSILAIAIVLLAALAPSCGSEPTPGTIKVQAQLCNGPWQGPLNYTLTPTGGSPISGTSVPATHSNLTPGTWTCAYVSGGPAGAFLNSIKPSTSQSLLAGAIVTFTLDFERNQDAAIKWLWWSQNGVPIQQPPTEITAMPCHIIDAHFKQWVKGCDGYNVTMNETSWLMILASPANPAPATIVVVDDWCAVNKTPDGQGIVPPVKVSQTASVDNVTREKGYNTTVLPGGPPVMLDVHTQWELVKTLNYTKAINWFGISRIVIEPGAHPCVLFELILPAAPGIYQFTLQASADVALVDDTDVNPADNHDMSPPVTLTVHVI